MIHRLAAKVFQLSRNLLPLSRQAQITAKVLPSRYWYRFALFASRLQGRLAAFRGGNGPLTEAVMLDHWLRELTFFGGPYPIPWSLAQPDVAHPPQRGKNIFYCWTHVPLSDVALRALVELGHKIDLTVAHPGRIVNGEEYIVPGLAMRLKTLSANGRVLARFRTALKQGLSVASLADAEMFGPISPQMLYVAGMVGAFVVFFWAERQPDGSILVDIQPAPYPLCKNDKEVEENLEFLRKMNRKAFADVGAIIDAEPMI